MDIIKRILDKCLSGRFLLTLIAGIAFLYCVTHKIMESAAIAAIVVSVFDSYFSRKDRYTNGDSDKPKS